MFADEPIVYVNDNVEYGKSKVLFFAWTIGQVSRCYFTINYLTG